MSLLRADLVPREAPLETSPSAPVSLLQAAPSTSPPDLVGSLCLGSNVIAEVWNFPGEVTEPGVGGMHPFGAGGPAMGGGHGFPLWASGMEFWLKSVAALLFRHRVGNGALGEPTSWATARSK